MFDDIENSIITNKNDMIYNLTTNYALFQFSMC